MLCFRTAKRGSWPGQRHLITARWYHTISWTGKQAPWMLAVCVILTPAAILGHHTQVSSVTTTRQSRSWKAYVSLISLANSQFGQGVSLMFCNVAVVFSIVSVYCALCSLKCLCCHCVSFTMVQCWVRIFHIEPIKGEVLLHSGMAAVCRFADWSKCMACILPLQWLVLHGKEIVGQNWTDETFVHFDCIKLWSKCTRLHGL